MQRALIIGVSGFVGGHLAEHLFDQGYEVWGTARHQSPSAEPELDGRVRLLYAELDDTDALRQAVAEARPDLVFHLAAQAHVAESKADPAGTYQVNILGQMHLLDAVLAEQPDAAVLVVGSSEEYGNPSAEDLPLNERAPLRPQSPYAVSKVAQDFMGYQYWAEHRLRCVRVRPFNHIGPRQSPRFVTAGFARQIAAAEAGLLDPPVIRVGNLAAQRDFTDVRDIVRGYLLALTKGAPGEVYNLGSGRSVSITEVLEFFRRRAKVEVDVQVDPALFRAVDIPIVACDASRLRKATGWQPQIPLEQTLDDVLDYWRGRVTYPPSA